jgi:hypothetical protein
MSKTNIFRWAMTLIIALGILIPQGVVLSNSPQGAVLDDTPQTPVTVELSVSPSGGKGGTAVVTCKVSSTIEIKNLKVSITANRVSYLSTNKWTFTIAKGGASEYSTTMLFSSEGNMSVTCTALGPNHNGTRWGDAKTLYYNVSASAVNEGWNMSENFQRNAAKLLDENAPELAAATSEFSSSVPGPEPVSPDGSQLSEPSNPITQATTCYKGRWYFYDRGTYDAASGTPATTANRAKMTLRPLVWSSIWLYDDDGRSGDDYLGAAFTDENGYWSYCVTNPQSDGDYIDLYVQAAMASTWYDVSTSSSYNPYYWYTSNGTATWSNTSGANFNTGAWYVPNTSTNLLAAWTYNDLTRANMYLRDPHRVNSDPSAPTTMEYTVGFSMVSRTKWTPSSTDGTYYTFSDDTIHLQGNDPRTYSALTHEWGHFVMNRLYGDDSEWPAGDGNCPSPHYYNGVSTKNCAWSEGWADALALLVPNDPLYRWASGATANNETRSGFSSGDEVEGNVAATFWDWMDKTNDGTGTYTDYVQLSFDSFLKAFDTQNDDYFTQYWTAWKALGEWCSPARDALKHNINSSGFTCP